MQTGTPPFPTTFDPGLAYHLAALAVQAYFYDTFEPWAKEAGYLEARGFHEDSIQAKVLMDEQRILVVFTATDLLNLKEWVKYDFDLQRSAMLGGWVHKGFRRALHAGGKLPGIITAERKPSLFFQINSYICLELLPKYGSKPVCVGGHSLGAAMAKIFIAELAEQQRTGKMMLLSPSSISAIYTTGEPRIGNKQVAHELELLYGGRMFRGVYHKDWVPGVPFRWMGYQHSGAPHFIQRDGQIRFEDIPEGCRYSARDHLPQRYARAYANLLRKERGIPLLPIRGDWHQCLKDIYDVVLHPGRGRAGGI